MTRKRPTAVQVRLTDAERHALEQAARDTGCSMSYLFRVAIRAYLREVSA